MKFQQADYNEFRSWLQLKDDVITWEGKFSQEFEHFWKIFFQDDLSLWDIHQRFQFLKRHVKTGPLLSWFSWLETRFILFCFFFKDSTILQLANEIETSIGNISLLLRDFLCNRYPHLEIAFSDELLISNFSQGKENLNFKFLKDKFLILPPMIAGGEEDIMTSIEVTLYPEWKNIILQLEKEITQTSGSFLENNSPKIKNYLKKLSKEITLVITAGCILLFALRMGNKWYEEQLVDRIRFFEPDFFKIEIPLAFMLEKNEPPKDSGPGLNQFEELDRTPIEEFFVKTEDERFEPESEVTMTSLEEVDREYKTAEKIDSGLEESESQKGTYRDNLSGTRKAYRILMKSVDAGKVKTSLQNLISKYSAIQADKVKPGTGIGNEGFYYNLYIPSKNLKEFLSETTGLEESTIFVSNSKTLPPAGKQRVFIWIKSI